MWRQKDRRHGSKSIETQAYTFYTQTFFRAHAYFVHQQTGAICLGNLCVNLVAVAAATAANNVVALLRVCWGPTCKE